MDKSMRNRTRFSELMLPRAGMSKGISARRLPPERLRGFAAPRLLTRRGSAGGDGIGGTDVAKPTSVARSRAAGDVALDEAGEVQHVQDRGRGAAVAVGVAGGGDGGQARDDPALRQAFEGPVAGHHRAVGADRAAIAQ